MYFYKIANIGFCFETDRVLKEYSPYDVFRVSGGEYALLEEKHHYVFTEKVESGGKCIFSSPSCDIYENGDVLIHENKRFDELKYVCTVCSKRDEAGGSFGFSAGGEQKLKVTTELFRCCNFISALLYYNAMIIHASFVIHKGKAILFTADSGGGKSTQADLWAEYAEAEIINGDRAVLKLEREGWQVYSLPLCGSSGICKQKSAPLKAVVSLKKSCDNVIRELSLIEKIALISHQITVENYKTQDFEKTLALEGKLVEETEILELSCTPTRAAVQTLMNYFHDSENL